MSEPRNAYEWFLARQRFWDERARTVKRGPAREVAAPEPVPVPPLAAVRSSKSPPLTMDERREFLARVMRRVERGEGGCLEWQGASGTRGHGRMRYKRHLYSPHRISLEVKLGRELGPDEFACHRCDNPPCIEPEHLFAGSARDNVMDAWKKGRIRPLQPNGAAVAESNRRRALAARARSADVTDIVLIPPAKVRKDRLCEWDGQVMTAAELGRSVGLSAKEIFALKQEGWFALDKPA